MSNEHDIGNKGLSPLARFIILAVCIGIVLSGVYLLGGIMTCRAGGGTMVKLACQDVETVGACLQDGKLYQIPEGFGGPDDSDTD